MLEDKIFNNHIMFCNSTGNQTINIIPAMQFGIKKAVVISTEHADKCGWTERLLTLMAKHTIYALSEKISADEEKNTKTLTEKLIGLSRNYDKAVWNISGGQKIPTISFHNAFQKRIDAGFLDDATLYVEGNDPAIWYYGMDFKTSKVRIDSRLSMSEILRLYNSEPVESSELYPRPSADILKKLEIGKTALEYYRNDDYFREAFFACMSPPEELPKTLNEMREHIRIVLNDIKPLLNELTVKKTGYIDFEKNIVNIIGKMGTSKNLRDIDELLKKIKIISRPGDLYDDYWNSIKKCAIDKAVENLSNFKHRLFVFSCPKSQDVNRLISEIKSIGGDVDVVNDTALFKEDIKRFSSIERNGFLFEWMVAASIIEIIKHDERVRNSISDVYWNVKTRKADGQNSKPDSELDIVITAKSGRLILLEVKTYEFSGDIAKSKESSAYKKSGPFGKAVMVGPLLKNMVKVKANNEKQYPPYIAGKIREQEETARQNSIDYIYIDGIIDLLKKELHIKDMR